jgi:1-acyl-sn-glycerol-3-phosphate acyltransferase
VVDPFFLALAPRRRVRFMAKAELWRYLFVRWGMEAYGAFPIERGNGDQGAMAHAGKMLTEGRFSACSRARRVREEPATRSPRQQCGETAPKGAVSRRSRRRLG